MRNKCVEVGQKSICKYYTAITIAIVAITTPKVSATMSAARNDNPHHPFIYNTLGPVIDKKSSFKVKDGSFKREAPSYMD